MRLTSRSFCPPNCLSLTVSIYCHLFIVLYLKARTEDALLAHVQSQLDQELAGRVGLKIDTVALLGVNNVENTKDASEINDGMFIKSLQTRY